jgi:hypothetical protein
MAVVSRLAAVAASVVAVAAIGVAGPAAASAVTVPTPGQVPTYLCTASQPAYCTYAEGAHPVAMKQAGSGIHLTTWLFQLSGYTLIKQTNTDLCLQLDHAANNAVIESTCNKAASYQEWERVRASVYWQYRSKWDPSLCITYNGQGHLRAGGCSNPPVWQKEFYYTVTS